MGYIIGTVLAFLVSLFARWTGLDRDRSFYPTILIIVGSYYVLFASMGGSTTALLAEALVMMAFAACAVAGLKRSVWLVVAGLAGHGLFDFTHAHFITNAGMPTWWPSFCGAYDVVAAACLAGLTLSQSQERRVQVSARS